MVSKKTPQVSVILPTYNRAKLLDKTIRSVVAQTYKDWELIVIDDASTDETPQMLKDWEKKDYRIRIFRNNRNMFTTFGVAKNLNFGLGEARGKYIARLDDDDYWCNPDKLKIQVDFLEKNPEYVVVGGGVIVINEKERELFRYFKHENDEDIRRGALFANPFSHTTVMFVKEDAIAVGGYGKWKYAEDWDLWLYLGMRGFMYNFKEYFTKYLMGDQNNSFIYQKQQSKMILGFIRAHRYEYPGFWRAYTLNLFQYLFSFLPFPVRRNLHAILAYIKRKFF